MILLVLLVFGTSSAVAAEEDPGWPRVIRKNGKQLTIYQPQVDYWRDYKELRLRCAIAVKTGQSQPEKYGVAEMDAETAVDHAARVVTMTRIRRELRFPNATESAAASLRKAVDELYPTDRPVTVSLDRVLACLDPGKQAEQEAVDLNIDPPKIFYSDKPAILMVFMGEPQLKPVSKDDQALMFAVNTNWDVFYDTGSQEYFILDKDSWLSTRDLLAGPWKPAGDLPAGLSNLPPDENWADVRAALPGKRTDPPVVFTSTEPAELILTQGAPNFSPISGTKLMRVANTDSPLFMDTADGNFYFLVAGRWFRAAGLEGPWTAASTNLPADFARIPDKDPAAYVKASVPGTTNAQDAVLLASVPTTTEVKLADPPKDKAVYNGEPDFKSIPGTKVAYAANSSNQVFLVDGSYYWCDKGKWLKSSSPNGPWAFTTDVPASIYTIPPSHPAHNVTYVTAQESAPGTAVYKQTSGYSGEYVATTGVLMLGAGMLVGSLLSNNWDDHHDYYSPYPVPYSYGGGARYSYAYGGYYRAAPVAYGPYGGAGAGAVYNPNTGNYARGAYAYGPAGGKTVRQAYNPDSGAWASSARVGTPYGSAGRGAAYNPSTGTAARSGYRSAGFGSVAGVQTSEGTGAVARNTLKGQGMVAKGQEGNVYAGRDGTVYKKDSSGNWSSNSGSGWQTVTPPQPKNAASQATTRSAPASETAAGTRPQASQDAQATAKSTAPRETATRTAPQAGQGGQAAASRRTQSQAAATPSRTREQSTARQSVSSQPQRASIQDLDAQANARQRGNQLTRRVETERSFGGGQARSFGGSGGQQRGGGLRGRR